MRTVKIAITQIKRKADGTYSYVCKPDPAVVKGKDRTLHWTVVTKGWRFHLLGRKQPIQVSGKKAKTQFPHPPVFAADGRQGFLQDRNGKVEEFSYTVRLVHVSGAELAFDPGLSNRNGAH
jgi:hypothetical protein